MIVGRSNIWRTPDPKILSAARSKGQAEGTDVRAGLRRLGSPIPPESWRCSYKVLSRVVRPPSKKIDRARRGPAGSCHGTGEQRGSRKFACPWRPGAGGDIRFGTRYRCRAGRHWLPGLSGKECLVDDISEPGPLEIATTALFQESYPPACVFERCFGPLLWPVNRCQSWHSTILHP